MDDGAGGGTANNCAVEGAETGYTGGATVELSITGVPGAIASTTTDALGKYLFLGLLAGTYNVDLTVPAVYSLSTTCTDPIPKDLPPDAPNTNFGIIPNTISGLVFVDSNENGAPDPAEVAYSGATLSESVGGTTATSDADPDGDGRNYSFVGLAAGTYDITLTLPAGFQATTAISATETVPPNKTVNFGIAPLHSIEGHVFVDNNKNKVKDGGESDYTSGSSTIEIHSGSSCSDPLVVSITGSGFYDTGPTLPSLPSGDYAVCYTSLPSGYIMTFPLVGLPPRFFAVTVGPTCDASSGNLTPFSPLAATCNASGNIIDLNFGISNSIPWFQSKGLDMRIDSGFIDRIPAGNFASLNGGGFANNPGIIFSGSLNYNPSPGNISSTNWLVDPPYPETFTPSQLNVIKTSYAYLLAIADKNDLIPENLGTNGYCGASNNISSCTLFLPANPGLYIANGNLNIDDSYTFLSNQDYVILVNGKLTIKGNLTVPNGSTVTFAASSDIIVDKDVGQSSHSSTTPNLEGFYSAGGHFTINSRNYVGGVNDCTLPVDLRLNIAGAVVTNANLSSGSLQNRRDLCGDNPSYPSLYISERPDFILNAPQFIQPSQTIWQEVAP